MYFFALYQLLMKGILMAKKLEVLEWIKGLQNNNAIVEEIGIGGLLAMGWGLIKNRFRRPDGRFFQILGIMIKNAPREISDWPQLIIQRENGTVILVISPDTGRILVQAKFEPGYKFIPFLPGGVALNASFAASQANMDQIHGGKRPTGWEIALKVINSGLVKEKHPNIKKRILSEKAGLIVQAPEDGGSFFGKANDIGFVFMSEEEVGSLESNERWLSLSELFEAMLRGYLGYHLLQVLGAVYLAEKHLESGR